MRLVRFIVLTLSVFMVSCKDYLNMKSDSSFVIPKSLEDLQGLLDDSQQMNINSYPIVGLSLADEYFVNDNEFNKMSELGRGVYTWNLNEYRGGPDWGNSYKVIYNTNLVLEILDKIEKSTINENNWNRVKGSALFFRSFVFLALITQYAHAFDENSSHEELGIPLRLSSNVNDKSTRATVYECYKKIVEDLKEAEVLLPDISEYKTRPSKSAALALLARVSLYMRKYDDVLKYSTMSLKLNSKLMNFYDDEEINKNAVNYPISPFNKETIFFGKSTGSWGAYYNSISTIDSNIINSYAPGDLRKDIFFNKNNLSFRGGFTGDNGIFVGITTSELFLMRAEARAYLNDVIGALEDINFLLSHRWDQSVEFVPIGTNNRVEVLEMVRLERRKELVIRNLRWIDIKRYNREGENILLTRNINNTVYTLRPDDAFYAFLLPQDIIELTNMQQN